MGPVMFITGNVQFGAEMPPRIFASMGPVMFITGNARLGAVKAALVQLASMGPVMFITGNVMLATSVRNECRLQWGR